jgi:serine/threonine protein phosphatase PrpC
VHSVLLIARVLRLLRMWLNYMVLFAHTDSLSLSLSLSLCVCSEHHVKEGDLIVVASDGLFDNMFDQELVEIIAKHELDKSEEQIASSVVSQARVMAQSRTRHSPFSVSAAAHGYSFLGGKMDDITVVVGRVVVEENPSNGH